MDGCTDGWADRQMDKQTGKKQIMNDDYHRDIFLTDHDPAISSHVMSVESNHNKILKIHFDKNEQNKETFFPKKYYSKV